MIIAGIDEAGRGPCIGPMVMGVATIMLGSEHVLKRIGVKDSKLLSPAERLRQETELKKELLEQSVSIIEPGEIDSLRDRKSLNEIEAMRAAELLNSLVQKPELVYIDSPDILQGNFAKRMKKYLSFETALKSEHRADSAYPIVSAASIIAKTERDRRIEFLSREYGAIGSGYPHDPLTISFLQKWLAENNSLPPIARKTWDTSQRMMAERFQTRLF